MYTYMCIGPLRLWQFVMQECIKPEQWLAVKSTAGRASWFWKSYTGMSISLMGRALAFNSSQKYLLKSESLGLASELTGTSNVPFHPMAS